MKKILIYMHEGDLTPTGGPRGYNYNLKQGLKEIGVLDNPMGIEFSYLPGISTNLAINNKVNNIRSKKIRQFVNAAKSIYKKGMMMYGPRNVAEVNLTKYDAVHFHAAIDMYSVKDSLKNYNGKVILTSHTPTTPSKEIYENLSDFEKKYMGWFYKKLPEIEKYCFDRADYIVFPCPEAEEPYFHHWKGYAELRERISEKYFYVPTGTGEKAAPADRKEIRKKYGIPENSFVVSYAGRHNEIKGYDSLKHIAEKILIQHNDVYFLIAGKEGPLYHLVNERWIEVGWTKDPSSIIKASDVFILPNKETYFDLVMLEVISLGQLILATNTGGNKYFTKYTDSGIFLYESEEDAVSKINKLIEISNDKLEELRQKNRKIYRENFTNKTFAENYMSMIKRILD